VAAGQRIEAATVFWAAGVAATPAAEWLGVKPVRHRAIPVGPDLRVPGFPDVFAIGDVMSLDGADGKPLPGLATVAKQQGAYVGALIARRMAGKSAPPPFRYRDLGSLAIIGRSAAVADIGKWRVRGFVAWLLWGGVHLMTLMGVRNRVIVYVNWLWSWFTWGRGARLITGSMKPGQGAEHPANAPSDMRLRDGTR
jgi:NADH dehydrogenase